MASTIARGLQKTLTVLGSLFFAGLNSPRRAHQLLVLALLIAFGQGDGDGPAAGGGKDPVTGREHDYTVIIQPLDSVRLCEPGPDSGSVLTNGNDQKGCLRSPVIQQVAARSPHRRVS